MGVRTRNHRNSRMGDNRAGNTDGIRSHIRTAYSRSHNRTAYSHTRVCTDSRLAPPHSHSFGQVRVRSEVLWHDREPQA